MKCTVLVVEDDEAIRQSVCMLLESEGYKTSQAANGKEALKWLQNPRNEPCLVITDLMMPEMNGHELIACMQEVDMMLTIPIVVVSAAASNKKVPTGRPFIKKPFELEALLKYVRKFCSTSF